MDVALLTLMNVKVPILVQEIHKLGVLTLKGVSGEEKNNRFQHCGGQYFNITFVFKSFKREYVETSILKSMMLIHLIRSLICFFGDFQHRYQAHVC